MHEPDQLSAEIATRQAAESALQLAREELAGVRLELEQVRIQATAAAAQRESFMAALSHEMRTPLNPVLLIASEAAENLALPEPVRRDFATIAKNAELEARLIDDLLDLDRITRGKISLDKRGLDARAALEDAIANVRTRLDAKELDLITTLDARPHAVFGDSARLQQVFWTILKQTVKFAPPGKQIRIVSVIDDPSQQIAIVFSTGADGSAPPRIDGPHVPSPDNAANSLNVSTMHSLGLGMTIARTLIEAHAGTIEIMGTTPEKGASFTVRLPLATNSTPPFAVSPKRSSPEAGNTPTPPVRGRLLLVEDHEPTRVTLARLLTRRNFAVMAAGSVEAALKAAAANEFDFVICDISLPDGDGYALMTALTERHGLQGIAVTGFGLPADLERSEAAGFIAHITKPVSVQALEAAFKNAQSSGAIKLA